MQNFLIRYVDFSQPHPVIGTIFSVASIFLFIFFALATKFDFNRYCYWFKKLLLGINAVRFLAHLWIGVCNRTLTKAQHETGFFSFLIPYMPSLENEIREKSSLYWTPSCLSLHQSYINIITIKPKKKKLHDMIKSRPTSLPVI